MNAFPAAIKTICAWCGIVLTDGPAAPVSHGICTACAARLRARIEARARFARIVDECDHCGAEFTGPPVMSEEQRLYYGYGLALRFCSTSCLDNACEADGMRRAERSLE